MRGARGEAAQRHGAQSVGRAFADVRDQRVEAARGIGEVLQAAVVDARVGAQREVEGGIDRGVGAAGAQMPLDDAQAAALRPACTCTRG